MGDLMAPGPKREAPAVRPVQWWQLRRRLVNWYHLTQFKAALRMEPEAQEVK